MRSSLAVVAMVVAGATGASTPSSPLQHARALLAAREFPVADATQPDRPAYVLDFTRRQANVLRPRGAAFVYSGIAHDRLTDSDLRVTFALTRRGRIRHFAGPDADTSQPSFPIRATFYYAWYPEAWSRYGIYPYSRYEPSLTYYGGAEPRVIRRHVEAMRYGHLAAGIYSWWGPHGYPPTDDRFFLYLAAARRTPFRWAIYYEREGYEDPAVAKIRADLEYVRDNYASRPAYLRLDGRFVVFVYASGADSCETARRWAAANTVGAYVVLSGFHGWPDCPWQPQAWHQYSATREEYTFAPSSFMISPGFEEATEPSPRLARDLDRWRRDIADMVASNAPWQLVISFNEWPEGTSIESAREWETPSGYGAYLDALHQLVP